MKREFKERKMKRKKDVNLSSAGISSRNSQCRQAGHTDLASETRFCPPLHLFPFQPPSPETPPTANKKYTVQPENLAGIKFGGLPETSANKNIGGF